MTESAFTLGETRIDKVFELSLNNFQVTQLLPNLLIETVQAHPEWLDGRVYDPETNRVFLSVHTWLVRRGSQIILIDTGAGNDKDRPQLQVLDHLHTPYLDRLAALGVRPEQVDVILLTHIHADHVGWNTRRDGEFWTATFPNATLICSEREWRYGAALAAGNEAAAAAIREEVGLPQPLRVPTLGVFTDSMAPLESSGRIRLVKVDGGEVLDGIRFLPAMGHSIDHAAIAVDCGDREAVFGGDILHHPFELRQPDLVSMFCEFPEAARSARARILNYVVDKNALYFSSHFPDTSAE